MPHRVPTREELGTHRVGVLQQSAPNKADLLLVDLGEGVMVVKDFGGKPWWVRLIGRLQISRECRAYRWLGPMPELPHFVGRVDRLALALERVPGERLADSDVRFERGAELLPALQQAVARLHERGLVHLDLRSRENVLLGPDDRIRILDLASASWFRPSGLAHRLFFRWFKVTDNAAMLKWKNLLAGDAVEYTAEEQEFLDRYRFWRSLWPFNRKRAPKNDR